jgi:hypothetical protein
LAQAVGWQQQQAADYSITPFCITLIQHPRHSQVARASQINCRQESSSNNDLGNILNISLLNMQQAMNDKHFPLKSWP